MYERYYGLQERPFDLSPNPRFLCFTPQHREALAHLDTAWRAGPASPCWSAKPAPARPRWSARRCRRRPATSTIVHLSNPTLTRAEFFEYLAGGLRLQRRSRASRRSSSCASSKRALERRLRSPRLALVVDEAQSVPYELLEEIRLLTNAESAIGRSIAVALVGQPELARRLDEPRLRQLKQRVVLRCELTPLSLKDTAAYIAGRVKTAGGEATRLFTRDAVIAIHQHSKRHSARHQRDLRQRAGQRLCRGSETRRREHRCRGVPDRWRCRQSEHRRRRGCAAAGRRPSRSAADSARRCSRMFGASPLLVLLRILHDSTQ